jgi:hypothetical protein
MAGQGSKPQSMEMPPFCWTQPELITLSDRCHTDPPEVGTSQCDRDHRSWLWLAGALTGLASNTAPRASGAAGRVDTGETRADGP